MDIFLRVVHPLFIIGVIASYGWEALRQGNVIQSAVVVLVLAGLSQTYWKVQVSKHPERSKADIASLCIGVLAIVGYVILGMQAKLVDS